MKELIQARQISKHYGALQVLSEVQLEVAEQEIVAIVGPSGAGKTTLLNILSDRMRTKGCTLHGERLINDVLPLERQTFGQYASYVM